jgi:curved DNA-binding protein
MATNNDFIDFYEVLQISPNAELETIKRVYKLLATRLHPDNPSTGAPERFRIIKQAYETLAAPDKRAIYDFAREQRAQGPLPVFELNEFALGVDGETNRRIGILCLLYNSRRANEDKPGLSIMDLEKLMGFPREHLGFAVWYLKSKQYVTSGENSDIVITSEGIDHLESNLPTNRVAYKLLKGAENGTIHVGVEDEPPAVTQTLAKAASA